MSHIKKSIILAFLQILCLTLICAAKTYFALPAFLAQASLQYFDLALNVVYVFLQTGHFLSKQIASQYLLHASDLE